MTEIKPQFLDEESYAAKFDRQFPRDILTEGIVGIDDLKVTELTTPAMGVKVAAGSGYVQGDQATTQGHYRIYNDASKNLSIAASDPVNPRKDRIIAQIYDSVDIGGVDDKWVLEVLTGTPAPSPDPPALPDDALDLAIVLVGASVETIVNANITDQRSQIGLTIIGAGDGWTSAGETWTYASVDAPTFAFIISGDKTSKYSVGMRIKLTQTTVKYFIITKVAYSDPNTTITVYGGTDYTLIDATITNPFYSMVKAPLGFPLNPTKWTVEISDTEVRSQATPTQNIWYNIGPLTIAIPIGCWRVLYEATAAGYQLAATSINSYITLSTANNSESDVDFTAIRSLEAPTGTLNISMSLFREKILNLVSKTSYYLNTKTSLVGMATILIDGAASKTIIRAICAYL